VIEPGQRQGTGILCPRNIAEAIYVRHTTEHEKEWLWLKSTRNPTRQQWHPIPISVRASCIGALLINCDRRRLCDVEVAYLPLDPRGS
jgi:hypothetical protein